MAVNDSEKKTRAILESKAEKGKELQQFQEAQGQLLNLQAEQRNNLNEQRVISSMEAKSNQTVAQAAHILAASGGAAGGVVAAQPRIAPGTQSTLKKFGIDKPGRTTKTTQTTTQTPQKVSITNNTTNTTNNNIQLSQPQIPITQPQIPMRAGANGGDTARFRAWVDNAFAKQNEAAAIREKEYQKREWSLTRSTNKMIRKMGELGKVFADKMSPKNLSNVFGDQLKVVLFLMGFKTLAENFKGVLNTVSNIYNWFTNNGTIKSFWDALSNGAAKFIGGKPGETFLPALKGLFSELATLIGDKIDIALTIRGKALSKLKFPEIDLSEGLAGVIPTLGDYIGDVLSVAFSGAEGLSKVAVRKFKRSGKEKSLEHYEDKYSHTQEASHILTNGEDISMGDAVMADQDFRSNFKMAAQDYNSFGGLSNTVGAGVKQSQHLSNLLNNMKNGGEVNTDQFFVGFNALKNTASQKKGVCVTEQFIDDIGFIFGIPEFSRRLKTLCPLVRVRYIVVPKTFEDLRKENAGGFWDSAVSNYIDNKVISTVAGGGSSYLAALKKEFDAGNIATGTIQGVLGGFGSIARAGVSAMGSSFRGSAKDNYTVKMVRVDDPDYPYETFPTAQDKTGKPLVDSNNNIYYWLTYKNIILLENEIKKHTGSNFSFDDDLKSLETFSNYLNAAGNKLSGGKSTSVKSLEEDLYIANSLKEEELNMNEAYDIKHGNGDTRLSNLWYNTKNSINHATSLFTGFFNSDHTRVDLRNSKSKAEKITKAEQKKNALAIADLLLKDKDLNLSSSQVAGILGNIGVESGFNPEAINPNDGGYPSEGLAQWRSGKDKFGNPNGRRDKFFEKFKKYPSDSTLTEQVEFIKHELLGDEKDALNKLKELENGTPEEYAEIFMKYYEKPSDDSKINHIERRKSLAVGAAELINQGIDGKVEYLDDDSDIKNEFEFDTGLGFKIDTSSIYEKYNSSDAARMRMEKKLEDEGGLVKYDEEGKPLYRNIYKDIENASTSELVARGYLTGDYAGLYNRWKSGEINLDDIDNLRPKGVFSSISYNGLSDEYKKSNYINEPGVSKDNSDVFGMLTDILKNNSDVDYMIKHGKWNDDSYTPEFADSLIKAVNIIDPSATSISKKLENLKRLLSGSTAEASNILFHLSDDKALQILKELVKSKKDGDFFRTKLDDNEAADWLRYAKIKHVVPKLEQLISDAKLEYLADTRANGIRQLESKNQDIRLTALMEEELKQIAGKDYKKDGVYNFNEFTKRLNSLNLTSHKGEENISAKNSPWSSYVTPKFSHDFSDVEIRALRRYFGNKPDGSEYSDEELLEKATEVFNGKDEVAKNTIYKMIMLEKEAEKYGIDSSSTTYESDLLVRKYFGTAIDKIMGNDSLWSENEKAQAISQLGLDKTKDKDLLDRMFSGKLTASDYKIIEDRNKNQATEVRNLLTTKLGDVYKKIGDGKIEVDAGKGADPVEVFNTIAQKKYLTPDDFITMAEAHGFDLSKLSEVDNLQIKTNLNQQDLLSALVYNTYLTGNQIRNQSQIIAAGFTNRDRWDAMKVGFAEKTANNTTPSSSSPSISAEGDGMG